MNRWEMEKKIAIKAIKDPAFKKKLQTHPKEALKELFKNEKGLDSLHIKIEEEKKDEWIIPIPLVSGEMEKLSDAELANLAAGSRTMPITPGGTC